MYGTESPVPAGVAILGWINCDHLFFQPGLCLSELWGISCFLIWFLMDGYHLRVQR